MEFSRQEYWSGLPFPSPGDFPDPEIQPGSPALQADSLSSEPTILQYKRKIFEKQTHGKSTILQYKIKKNFLRYSKDQNVTNLDSWALYSIEIDEAR